MLKFIELKQENMLVADYEAKVIELSRIIPHQVNMNEKKAKCFQTGLNPWIQNKVVVLDISSYATLVHKACIDKSGSELFDKEKVDRKRKPLQNNQNIEKKRWTHCVKKLFVK